MPKRLPSSLRIPRPRAYMPGFKNAFIPNPTPEDIALDKNPDLLNRIATNTRGRGIRNTNFRLPYLSNLKKMDPVFDDPYDVAAQTIRKTQKPGDPEIVLDPDGLYEEDDSEGNESYFQDIPEKLRPVDNTAEMARKAEWDSLVASTGMSLAYIRSLMMRTIVRNYVSNQTPTGKLQRVYVLSVVGNGNGLVGFGEGKALTEDGPTARQMSLMRAIKNMVPIERYENRTVYGEVEAKFGASRVYLRPRPPGFGIRANYHAHEICRCAGITDVSVKVRGSMNPMNVAKAMFEALRLQKLPSTIAKERGVHLIDVRERYFHAR